MFEACLQIDSEIIGNVLVCAFLIFLLMFGSWLLPSLGTIELFCSFHRKNRLLSVKGGVVYSIGYTGISI